MAIELKDGKLVDSETGDPIGDEVLGAVRKAYGLVTEEEATKQTNNAVQKRINEFKAKLKAAEESVTATAAEKEQLKLQIATLEEANMTAEQRAAAQAQEQMVGIQQQLEAANKKVGDYESRYRNEVATNSLMAAASDVKAINPKTFVTILRNNEEWVDVKDAQGNITGEKHPQYRMNKMNPTTGELEQGLFDSKEAAEILAAQEKYLVSSGGQSGLGQDLMPGAGEALSADQYRNMSEKQLQERGILPEY